jgi:hypothetical protein
MDTGFADEFPVKIQWTPDLLTVLSGVGATDDRRHAAPWCRFYETFTAEIYRQNFKRTS